MLSAIGIYQDDPNTGKLRKIAFAQKDKDRLFPCNQLENLELNSLPITSNEVMPNTIQIFQEEKEYHYLKKDVEKNILMGIVSRKELEKIELFYLFANIKHVHVRGRAVATTLDNIIENPVGFTGQDILISKIKTTNAEVIDIMIDNIDLIIERGEKLEQIAAKTDTLRLNAITFEAETKKLRSCCRWT
jgi:hypothetical protein